MWIPIARGARTQIIRRQAETISMSIERRLQVLPRDAGSRRQR
jgi:hypothetical protein